MEQLSEGQAVVVGSTGGTVQVVQMGQGGQTMMLPQAIQVAAPNGQIQVVPVSSLTSTGQQIVIQQPQTPQIIQTPDGQTYIYQPVQLEGQVQQAQPTGKCCNTYSCLFRTFSYNFLFVIFYLQW